MNSISLPPGVEIYDLSPRVVEYLWEKIKNYDILFADENRGDFEEFERRLTQKDTLCLRIDEGILIMTDIIIGHMAQIHACFWDHKLSIRLDLFRNCITWVFVVFEFVRLEAIVPVISRGLRRFLQKKLNFTEEGILRHRMKYQGEFIDVAVYSLLREEALWV